MYLIIMNMFIEQCFLNSKKLNDVIDSIKIYFYYIKHELSEAQS